MEKGGIDKHHKELRALHEFKLNMSSHWWLLDPDAIACLRQPIASRFSDPTFQTGDTVAAGLMFDVSSLRNPRQPFFELSASWSAVLVSRIEITLFLSGRV